MDVSDTSPDQIAENDRPDPMDTPDLSTDIAAAEEVTARFRKPARPAETVRREKRPMSTVHAHYKRNGYESCPKCGEWLGAHSDGDPHA